MALFDRVWKIVAIPVREWPVVARETTRLEPLFVQYALPLAAVGPACAIFRLSLFGIALAHGDYRVPLLTAVVEGLISLALALLGVYVLAQAVNVLTASFGGDPDFEQALKLVTYSYTPIWLTGLLLLLPQSFALRILASVIGLYSVFLIYLGLPPLLKVPKDSALGFAVVVAVAAIGLGLVFDFVVAALRVGLGLRG
jgi:hypothetical protein